MRRHSWGRDEMEEGTEGWYALRVGPRYDQFGGFWYNGSERRHTNTTVVRCELKLLKDNLVAVLLQFFWTIGSLQ
jgi:hypothetical protein